MYRRLQETVQDVSGRSEASATRPPYGETGGAGWSLLEDFRSHLALFRASECNRSVLKKKEIVQSIGRA